MADRATTSAELSWEGDLRFTAASGAHQLAIDSSGKQGPSPMQTLAISLAGCMAIDVVDILQKGRHQVRALHVSLTGVRAAEPPRRFEEIALHYRVSTDAPSRAIERAIALSREKYCSVWHSMRQDIQLTVTHAAD